MPKNIGLHEDTEDILGPPMDLLNKGRFMLTFFTSTSRIKIFGNLLLIIHTIGTGI